MFTDQERASFEFVAQYHPSDMLMVRATLDGMPVAIACCEVVGDIAPMFMVLNDDILGRLKSEDGEFLFAKKEEQEPEEE